MLSSFPVRALRNSGAMVWWIVAMFFVMVASERVAAQTGAPASTTSAGSGTASNPSPGLAAQPPETRNETISGRVVNAQQVPMAGVVVMATMAPDRMVFLDTTSASGEFALHVAKGTGDYLVYIAAPGFSAFRKRITRTGSDSTFRVDAQLAAPVSQLATVRIAAKQATPQRTSNGPVEAGAAERLPDALTGAISPDLAGDFNALAIMVPGMTATAGGYSALGLGASQNSTTLNGAQFGAASLPRDVRTSTRVTTSTFDPARGWFSGSNVGVELIGAGLFASSRAHVTLDAPALQAGDQVSRSAAQKFSNVRFSYGADGPVTWENKYFYNLGLQADRRTSDAASLISATPLLQQQLGISQDSATAFMQALNAAHIPVTAAGVGRSRVSDNMSVLARIERNPLDMKTYKPVKVTFGLLAVGQQSRDQFTGVSSLSTPARGGEAKQQSALLQGSFSRFFGKNYLHDVRSTLSWNDRTERSLLALPEGRVFVQSELDDEAGALTTLLFGGNSAGSRSTSQFTWETINTTKFYASGRESHGVKVTSDLRYDGYRSDVRSNPFGTYTYASLADVTAGTPTSFSRTLSSPPRVGGSWNAFLAVGDNWRITRAFQLLYGARLEGNVFTSAPFNNPALQRTLGVRSDYAPSAIHVSPRFGFTWARSPSPGAVKSGPAGQYALGSPRYLRGGIGEFRNMMSPSLLAEPRVSNGLPSGASRLSCIASATPVANWSEFGANSSNIPSGCAVVAASGAGAASTAALSDSAPNIRVIAPGYRPPTSWRANLAYASRNLHVDWSLEGIYSLNLNQPSSLDLNFNPTTRFTLATDARPVYVPLAALIPASGLIPGAPSRVNGAYARVMSSTSDLRSVSRQLTLNVRPVPEFMRRWYASGSYTYSNNRAQSRGFDGSTAASPITREWSRGDFDVRHQLLSQFGFTRSGVTLAGMVKVQSGLPYTPMVAGDINGDGLSNDRAFVVNPAMAGNTELAAATRELLAGANASTRKCLASQQGKVASRNSCTGPWSAAMNAQISFAQRALKNRRISSIALNISNPLAAIDRMVHADNDIRGWGSVSVPDGNLLVVRGFDPATRDYKYAVNQRFGRSQMSSVLNRAPFRITLDISMDLGRPAARQQLTQWLKPGRAGNAGPRMSQEDLKKRYERNVPDPYKIVLQDSDSLLVNRAQVEALVASQVLYRARLDTVWTELAADLASLGDDFNDGNALKRQEAAIDRAWEITRQEVHAHVVPVLTRIQLALLPSWVGTLYRTKVPTSYRMYVP